MEGDAAVVGGGEDGEKQECSFTADGNTDKHRHSGRQYGSFS